MELLRFLISFFIDQLGLDQLKPTLDQLTNGNTDIKSLLSSLDFEKLLPVIQKLSEILNKNSPTKVAEEPCGLTPVIDIADKEIIYALNSYFAVS
ncbi:MAG: hypothetical protein II988_01660 [Clostridia bacterium]|nr:hypothetical protein [Clostridia bacterium]